MEQQKLIINNEAGLNEFTKTLQLHDRATLRSYWIKTKTRKFILVLRRLAAFQWQVCMMPPKDFNLQTRKIQPRYFNGYLLRCRTTENAIMIFGTDEVLAQIPGANQTPPSDVVFDKKAPSEEIPEMKKKAKAPAKKKPAKAKK